MEFDKCGVWPQIMSMECGVTVATYGRYGLYLRGTSDEAALVWQPAVDIPLKSTKDENSCAYTGMLPLSDTEFLLIYSDFYYPNDRGIPVKTIIAVTVTIVSDG